MLKREPASLTEGLVLRALIAGFALVVILLGVAGLVAVQGTRAIEEDTAKVIREQLVRARLQGDLQAEQNTLAAILYRLMHKPDSKDRAKLLLDLESADRELARVAVSAAQTHEASRWSKLNDSVQQFSRRARAAIQGAGQPSPEELSRLSDLHNAVGRVEKELLDSSESRVAETERRIEIESRRLAERSRISLGACLALALICAALTVWFARRSIRRMEWQANELSSVSWHMLQGQESAARRFSHELHDELGQSLAAIKSNLTSGRIADARSRSDCIHLVDEAIANVRELAQLLRPVILDDFGLDAGLRWLVDRFGERTGLEASYISSFHQRLPDESETHLFRITQEALTNVARHAGATSVVVKLHFGHQHILLSIEDNGRGLAAATKGRRSSLGMTGMRARAEQLGGSFRLRKPKAGGTRIEVEVPWVQEPNSDVEQESSHSVS
jgi:signal transduction histidine kinase